VLRGEVATTMIDYFSLGVIAYEMVIGVTPFTDNSPQAVFENILAGQIEWPEVGTGEGEISA
jgi:serine/threonine-protein kinase RIM15